MPSANGASCTEKKGFPRHSFQMSTEQPNFFQFVHCVGAVSPPILFQCWMKILNMVKVSNKGQPIRKKLS